MKDDVISRRAAIDALGKKPLALVEGEYELGLCNQWEHDVDAIKSLPSAEPKRESGEWILADTQNEEDMQNGNYRYICSRCGYSDIHAKAVRVPYCWHCGADMRGEQT